MIDKDGLMLLMGLLIVILLFLFLGNNGSVKLPKLGHKSKPAGKVVEVTGPDGRKHKAVLLPDNKKPEPQRRNGIKWKYR